MKGCLDIFVVLFKVFVYKIGWNGYGGVDKSENVSYLERFKRSYLLNGSYLGGFSF